MTNDYADEYRAIVDGLSEHDVHGLWGFALFRPGGKAPATLQAPLARLVALRARVAADAVARRPRPAGSVPS